MAGASRKDPIAILRDIDQRSRRNAAGLPAQQEVKRSWPAIAFRIGAQRLVTPLGEVAELLRYPPLSRIPGAKSWVKGMANVRGNLLPIVDLPEFLGAGSVRLTPRSRVLVVRRGEVMVGLLVDEVLGLRHYYDEERVQELPNVDSATTSYLSGSVRRDGELLGIFSTFALAQSALFMQVAV